MLKRFFETFLAVMAALWATVFLFGVLAVFAVGVIAVAASGEAGGTKAELKEHNILTVTLDGVVTDRATPVNIFNGIYGKSVASLPLNDIVSSIKNASEDSKIDGMLLDCRGGSAGLAQMQAIITAIKEFKKSGKWVYAYGDNYTQGNYMLACAADSIYINPIGMVDVHGLSATTLYFKDLLDKIGVEAQVVKVGTYKSAVEPFILNEMSDANREQQTHYLGCIWQSLSGYMAQSRKVSVSAVNSWANGFLFAKPTEDYRKLKVVDALKYRHEFDDILADKIGDDEPNYVEFSDYASLKSTPANTGKGKQIAVLYAVGDITEDGDDGITSESLVPQILDLAEKDEIDGLVFRVNSGGGSAFASEQIWEALQQFKSITGKPFYVSMGDYAASGGYYISCGADRIYAEPLTITGSIGIFGIIPSVQDLLGDKLGVHSATVSTNTGGFPTFFKDMTPEQRGAMQGYVNRGYELFVSRCAAGRHIPADSIKAIAEGRVWDGTTALKLGLVDKLGGLQQAVTDMAAELDASDNYYVAEYPKIKFKWWEDIVNIGTDMKMRSLQKDLGEFMPYYVAVKNIRNLCPLQARMDYVDIK